MPWGTPDPEAQARFLEFARFQQERAGRFVAPPAIGVVPERHEPERPAKPTLFHADARSTGLGCLSPSRENDQDRWHFARWPQFAQFGYGDDPAADWWERVASQDVGSAVWDDQWAAATME